MPATSDIRFMRSKGTAPATNIGGTVPSSSEWHVMIPGMGGKAPWPGLACETPLEGTLEVAPYTAMAAREAGGEKIHAKCRKLADEFINKVAKRDLGTFGVGTEPTPGKKSRKKRS